jgi:phosphinothricin acetyltransferase
VYTDVPAITGIYNEAILTTTATFDKEPKTTTSQRKWFKAHGPKNPIVVAVADGKVVGWSSLSAYSDRCAYAETAEISVYVKESFRNQGLGKKLMQAVLDAGKKAGLHTVISRIAGGNNVSINLHHELGFTDIGVMKEVGTKFGQLLDVYLLQRMY